MQYLYIECLPNHLAYSVIIDKDSMFNVNRSCIYFAAGLLNSSRAPSQYPKRRLFVRSRKVSKPRDLYLELSDRSEI